MSKSRSLSFLAASVLGLTVGVGMAASPISTAHAALPKLKPPPKKNVQNLRPGLTKIKPTVPKAEPVPEPWKTTDIIDSRIDVSAQYALMRMFRGSLFEQYTASQILSAVKDGRVGGVYIADQKVPALQAKAAGDTWWTMVPKWASMICYEKPANKSPLMVMAKGVEKQPQILDEAMSQAFWACGFDPVTPRGYAPNLPAKQPRKKQKCDDEKGTASIEVSVLFDGKPLSGHDVTLSGPKHSSGTSNGAGVVRFSGLPAGDYVVSWASTEGFEMRVREVAGTCAYTVTASAGETAPGPSCDVHKWHEVFNQCGLKHAMGAAACVLEAHGEYWKGQAKGPDAEAAWDALEGLAECYSDTDTNHDNANACHEKANKASHCSITPE